MEIVEENREINPDQNIIYVLAIFIITKLKCHKTNCVVKRFHKIIFPPPIRYLYQEQKPELLSKSSPCCIPKLWCTYEQASLRRHASVVIDQGSHPPTHSGISSKEISFKRFLSSLDFSLWQS